MAPDTPSARSVSARIGNPAPNAKGVFRKEGEYWTVGYAGKTLRMKDSKELGYLTHLMRHPGVEFHVLDMAGGIASRREEEETNQSDRLPRGDDELEKSGIHIGGLGDAGEILDEQAKVAYRRRLPHVPGGIGRPQ